MNKTREISIPTLRDKLVLKYLSNYLLETFFKNQTVSTIQAMIKDIKHYKSDYKHFIKTDVETFFPTINHDILLVKLSKKIKDKWILDLIKKAITQTTVDIKSSSSSRCKYNNQIGVPQGLSISGILADIYLQDLDAKYQKNKNIKYFRFVDDILILSNHKDLIGFGKRIQQNFKKLKLNIHGFQKDSKKSSHGNTHDSLEFLGHHFDGDIISVRDSSVKKLYENLNALFTLYKFKSITKEQLYTKLNYKIVGCTIDGKKYGWLNFFNQLNNYKLLYTLDKFIEKMCLKYKLDYLKLKKFSKAIFEMKNPKSKYMEVQCNSLLNIKFTDLKYELQSDVEFY
jgi:hypothetical protein